MRSKDAAEAALDIRREPNMRGKRVGCAASLRVGGSLFKVLEGANFLRCGMCGEGHIRGEAAKYVNPCVRHSSHRCPAEFRYSFLPLSGTLELPGTVVGESGQLQVHPLYFRSC